MKRKLLLVLSVLMFGANAFAQSQEDGIKQMTKENYQTAINIFKKIINDDPKNGENYYYLGESYLFLNKQDSAKQYFDLGVQAEPKSPYCYVGIGEWYLNQNDVVNAKKYFDEASANTSSKDTKIMVAIAEAYTNSEHSNYDEAINTLNRALDINAKNADIYIAMGNIYYAQNNGGPAIDNYDKAIEAGKEVAYCDTREGIIWTHALQYNQALPKFQDALKTDSSFAPAYSGLGELYYLTRQYTKAQSTYARYLQLADKNDYTKLRYAEILYLSNNCPGAITQLTDLEKRDTTTYIIYRLLGYSYYRTADYANALTTMRHFFRVVKANKIIDSDYIYYGRILSKNNMDSLAVLTYNKAISIDTLDCTLRAELAGMLYKDKKYNDAAKAWQNDIRCLKDQAGLNEYFKLGLSYYFSNQYGKADTTFKNAEKYNSTWIQLPLFRARAEAHIDTDMSLGTAKAMYDSALVMARKDSVHNTSTLVEIYIYDGDYVLQQLRLNEKTYTEDMKKKAFDDALDYFNRALAIDPNNATAKQSVDELNQTLKAYKTQQQSVKPRQQ